jgi:hypothetical protein
MRGMTHTDSDNETGAGPDEVGTLVADQVSRGLAAGDDPAAGAVFAVVPGTSGMPALEFAG